MRRQCAAQSALISYLVEAKCQHLQWGTESTEAALKHADLSNLPLKTPLQQMAEEIQNIITVKCFNVVSGHIKPRVSLNKEITLSHLIICSMEVMLEAAC